MTLLAQPTITQQPSDQVVTNGGTAVFSVAVSGPGPFTYQWQFNGTNFDLITTVAGNGTAGYSGDGGAATNAALNYPSGLAMDGGGNLFIADRSNHRIRKVATNGFITTVAGNGTGGSSNDGGMATNALLYYPGGIAVDSAENLFIADLNNRIRRVDTNGIITTVAGNGSNGYSGDGGAATNAMLGYPYNVTVDGAGNLFFADYNNNRVRKVDTNGIITTVAGNGTNGYSGDSGAATNAMLGLPYDVAVDTAGNLFIADYSNNRIRRVDTNGLITTVAGNGNYSYSGDGSAATNAGLGNPRGVTVDGAGNLFLTDISANRIRRVDTNGIITTVAGGGLNNPGDGGPAFVAALGALNGVTTDSAGNVFLADSGNNRIRRVATVTPPGLPDLSLASVTTNNIGSYSVVVSDSNGSVTSSVAALNMPAFIVSSPQSQSVLVNGPVTFSAVAGSTEPLTYQWAFNGTNIDGATNSTLNLTSLQMSQTGAYSVVVSNPFGASTSSNAVLSVLPFTINTQPKSQTVALSSAVSFSVTASGQGPFSYQWQFQNANLPGATNSTLVLTNMQTSQSGVYAVVVSNIFGTVTSSNANLAVIGIVVWGSFNNGNSSLTNVPASATNVIAMAAGDTHCLALKADGTVLAWGGNSFGQTSVPLNLTNVVSVAAGSAHSLALRGDGTVALWGRVLLFGNSTVPPEATNVAALALGPGAQHALVLRSDGTVLDWGNNSYGLTNIPATARDIVAVASGATYCLALRADGKPVAWGSSQVGRVTPIPTTATNIVAIATSWYGNAALRADGTVLVWGSINTPPSSFTNVLDLAGPINSSLGASDILALRRNGTLVEYSGSVPKYPTNNITAIAAGSYNAFAVVGSGPPVFPGMPVNRTVATSSRAYFRAVAVGAMPLSYQWNCNGTNVPGTTNSVLVLTNVQPIQAGNYYTLTASNAFGMATNGAMFLNEVPSEFSLQPQTLSVAVGATAKFAVTNLVGVGSFTYQWQFNNSSIAGATNTSLSLTNVQLNQAGAYSLVAGNSYGNVTNNATLTVLPLVFNASSTNLLMTTNGLQFRLDSVYATQSVVIFASTDLVSWLTILTNPPATGSVLFLDTAATNLPQRFYRAVEQ